MIVSYEELINDLKSRTWGKVILKEIENMKEETKDA